MTTTTAIIDFIRLERCLGDVCYSLEKVLIAMFVAVLIMLILLYSVYKINKEQEKKKE